MVSKTKLCAARAKQSERSRRSPRIPGAQRQDSVRQLPCTLIIKSHYPHPCLQPAESAKPKLVPVFRSSIYLGAQGHKKCAKLPRVRECERFTPGAQVPNQCVAASHISELIFCI